jgi:hypothetical protein
MTRETRRTGQQAEEEYNYNIFCLKMSATTVTFSRVIMTNLFLPATALSLDEMLVMAFR